MEYANHISLKCQDFLTYAKTDDTNLGSSFNNPDSICIDTPLSEVLFNLTMQLIKMISMPKTNFMYRVKILKKKKEEEEEDNALKKIIKIMPKNQVMNLFFMVIQCQ